MNIKDIKNRYGYNVATSVCHIMLTGKKKVVIPIGNRNTMDAFFKGKRCAFIDIEVPTINDVLDKVSKLNKEVKHSTCPKNLRNRFYNRKKHFIQYLLGCGMVDKIIESEKHYKFIVGEHSFHQPKMYFPNGIKSVDGYEEYIPVPYEEEFSMDDYKDAMVGMVILAS